MKKLMATVIFLSLGTQAFAVQYKTVKENVSVKDYTAQISYPVLLKNSVPGYEAINKQIRTSLVENGCDTEEPMQPNMDYQASVRVVALNKNYVGYEISADFYCGGAHPDSYTSNMTFDSQTGAVVELENEVPAQYPEDGTQVPASEALQTKLAKIMYKHMDPKADYQGCYQDAEGGTEKEVVEAIKNFSPLITGLAANKEVILRLDPPHAEVACEFSVRVKYTEVKAFLNPEGKFQKWLK